MATRRERILEAFVERCRAIETKDGFATDAGWNVSLGAITVLGPDDPDVQIAVAPDDDVVKKEGPGLGIQLPVDIWAVAKANLENPHLAIEAVLGDIKKAVELADRTLGGLVPQQIERGTTHVMPREPGSVIVGAAITYLVFYKEAFGDPDA